MNELHGRENPKDNDLFFTCSLIDYIARRTKNKRADVVNPSHWDIGKVYKRLIKQVAQEENISVITALMEVYNSFISEKIDDYNSSMYYENPAYLFECFRENKVL